MKILIEDDLRITQYLLPTTMEESFLVRHFLNGTERMITLNSKDQKWFITSDIDYVINFNNTVVKECEIELNKEYKITFNSDQSSLYFYPVSAYENSYLCANISNNLQVLIGNLNNCNIVIPDVIPAQIRIFKDNYGWIFEDVNKVSYINKVKTQKKYLKVGDTIYIKSTKLIWMNSFIKVTNPNNSVVLNKIEKIEEQIIDNNTYTPITEKERSVELYNENDLFFHTPQLKFNIKNEEVVIDPPLASAKDEGLPLFLIIGSSIVMAISSMATGISAISNISSGNSTFINVLPSFLISISMLAGCILFPIIINKYQKKMKIKKEELRQQKYVEYLNLKRETIKKIIEDQSRIIRDNYINLDQVVKLLSSSNKKIWSREIGDNDFLTLRLGNGSKRANVSINALTDHFSLEDDALKKQVIEISLSSLLMTDVPITVSLIENSIFPIILECKNKMSYINGIMLQLMTFQSSIDLKLVFLIDKNTTEYWDYVRYLSHSLSDDKSTRFFASTEEEMKSISSYLEEEYNNRKKDINDNDEDDINRNEMNQKEYYKKSSPYYLIITDNFKRAKDLPIIKRILNSNSNYGFSLLMFESNLKNLPSKCNRFANIVDGSSGLFGKDLSSNDQATFQAEYAPNIDLYSCVSIISNIPVSTETSENVLPNTLEFLEMYDVGKIEQLNILNRWNTNNPTTSLSAPIGVYKTGDEFDLDLHEKAHGPHGLIAGSTGSGKSELIISYILSMAINYSPKEVQFVLIDYKGGGLAGAFENRETNLKLPHLVGTITNLDTNEMNRTLVSIQSELKRRQKIFNEVRDSSNESTIDIYKYQRLYREGLLKEPISHLFIICDEFAELKANQPDFMDELISTARIGRSLGVHLILATQKPSGVVNDQIWSNSRFKICLKVQTSSDSVEMLKRPEAANIKEVGRFYLQVGFDELFELGQSAWSGAKYVPNDKYLKKINDSIDYIDNIGNIKKSLNDSQQVEGTIQNGDQLSSIVKYIYNIAVKEKMPFSELWLPKIPEFIYINNLTKKYDFKFKPYVIETVIGEYDDPENQKQGLLTVNCSNYNNTAILGVPGSGKELLLSTMVYSACTMHSPSEVNFYILDFGAETLKRFSNLPHVGDVVTILEKDKISNLFQFLDKEINKRKELLAKYNTNYYDYCTKTGGSMPFIITIVNNYDLFLENYDESYEGFVNHLFREGIKYGMSFIITASAPNVVRSRTLQFFSNIIALQLNDPFDYKFYLGAPSTLLPSKIYGRGLTKIGEKVFEFQTAYIDEPSKVSNDIISLGSYLTNYYKISARNIPMIPNKITASSLAGGIKDLTNLPIGIDHDEMEVFKYNLTNNRISQIVGNNIMSRPSFILGLIEEFNLIGNIDLDVLDTTNGIRLNDGEGTVYNGDFDEVLDRVLIDNTSEHIHIILIVGIKSLVDSLTDESYEKLNSYLYRINKTKKTYVIISDNYSSFKKIILEPWYRNSVDSYNGIWIGTSANIQVVISINKLKARDANLEFEDLIYVVENGEYTVVKGLGEEDE